MSLTYILPGPSGLIYFGLLGGNSLYKTLCYCMGTYRLLLFCKIQVNITSCYVHFIVWEFMVSVIQWSFCSYLIPAECGLLTLSWWPTFPQLIGMYLLTLTFPLGSYFWGQWVKYLTLRLGRIPPNSTAACHWNIASRPSHEMLRPLCHLVYVYFI